MDDELEPFVDPVYRFALTLTRHRQLAEDLTQDCFLKAIRSRQDLRDPARLRPWLFRILFNLWQDHQRRRGRRREQSLMETDGGLSSNAPEHPLVIDEQRQQILDTMQTLPDQQRQVLFLIAVEALSHRQVGELLGISSAAVKSNLHLARKTMRQRLTSPSFQVGKTQ